MTEYLIAFFGALGTLTEIQDSDIPNAIDYQGGSLFVLISMGDLRARLPLSRMDPNPVQAAKEMFDHWKLMNASELEPILEGRRG